MTTKDTCHSFDTCPLRSSSLLIVHHEQQVILTASDDAFDILGRRDDQLINQPLALLSLSTEHGQQAHQVTWTRHAITQQWIQLEICVHHDPFSTASGLDYCLLRVISNESQRQYQHQQQQQQQSMATVTLLGLNSYGTIAHASPSSQFPHPTSRDMVGRPIMSFIHTDDVRPLCRLLRKSTTHPLLSSSTYTMDIRWLKPTTLKTAFDDTTTEFEWMQITIVNPTIYNHVPALNGRPICLLQPSNGSSSSCPTFGALSSLMVALENGRIYCMEFLNHLLACMIQLLHDMATLLQQQQPTQLSSITPSPQHIKVMDGDSIRLIPLSSSPLLSSSSSDGLFYLLSSTFLSYTMPTSFLPNRSFLEFLKPILPQTKSPSSPL